MSKFLLELIVKIYSCRLTMQDIKKCEKFQEVIECKLIDFVAGTSIEKKEQENFLDMIDYEMANPEELLKYRLLP